MYPYHESNGWTSKGVQILYKWRNEAKAVQSSETAGDDSNASSAQALLENDRLLQEKIERLEAENKTLRATLIKYRAALAAVLEEGMR